MINYKNSFRVFIIILNFQGCKEDIQYIVSRTQVRMYGSNNKILLPREVFGKLLQDYGRCKIDSSGVLILAAFERSSDARKAWKELHKTKYTHKNREIVLNLQLHREGGYIIRRPFKNEKTSSRHISNRYGFDSIPLSMLSDLYHGVYEHISESLKSLSSEKLSKKSKVNSEKLSKKSPVPIPIVKSWTQKISDCYKQLFTRDKKRMDIVKTDFKFVLLEEDDISDISLETDFKSGLFDEEDDISLETELLIKNGLRQRTRLSYL